jgi:hypothetical protein
MKHCDLAGLLSVESFSEHPESVERSRNAVFGKAEQSQDVSFFIELTINRRPHFDSAQCSQICLILHGYDDNSFPKQGERL